MDAATVYYIISGIAIVVMAINVIKAFQLKKAIVGGEVGEKWNYSLYLILFFFAGYIVSPLFLRISPELKNIMVSLIFLFGAIFVYIMITLTFLVITLLQVRKKQ
ncbi:MAG: hypothetical protein HXS46_17475 [Theionarchaea archaeon]|nr:hypothetical protein [Theionarchaea archaeon]